MSDLDKAFDLLDEWADQDEDRFYTVSRKGLNRYRRRYYEVCLRYVPEGQVAGRTYRSRYENVLWCAQAAIGEWKRAEAAAGPDTPVFIKG